eukprot:TRINITY_DN48132_c0_g1_i1.p1 TRINITY_DN48132_c0_g1~~TRINITY_DN48132_c0_g1_i1.p1  ORF type:complete len:150 (+),score=30.59 TRINITY_DN48132_c0_g1_i1:37-486(+)
MSMVCASRDAEVVSGRPWGPGGNLDNFAKSTSYEGAKSVKIDVDGHEEEVKIDDERGPLLLQPDGSAVYALLNYSQPIKGSGGHHTDRIQKTWQYLTSTEKTVLLHMVAKKNRRLMECNGLVLPAAPKAKAALPHPHMRGFLKILDRAE